MYPFNKFILVLFFSNHFLSLGFFLLSPGMGDQMTEDALSSILGSEIELSSINKPIPESKLLLMEIVLFNFKSFQGLHRISTIDNHITVIVGPNGSGKSNLLDSILFVLGFKAKKMRHSNLNDLVNSNGSECYVELHFNHFVIKRSVKKYKGQSTYYINGKELSSVDTTAFLRNMNIDLDNNRFLIMQGEIETIAMMNPLELLEYIEDCIGTTKYKEAISKLERTANELAQDVEIKEANFKFIENDYNYKNEKNKQQIALLLVKKEALLIKQKIVKVKRLLAFKKKERFTLEKEDLVLKNEDLLKRSKDLKAEIQKEEDERSKREKDILKLENEVVKRKREYLKQENIKLKKNSSINLLENRKKQLEKDLNKLEEEMKKYIKQNYEEEIKNIADTISTLEDRKKVVDFELQGINEFKERNKIINDLEKELLIKMKSKSVNLEVELYKKLRTLFNETSLNLIITEDLKNLEKLKDDEFINLLRNRERNDFLLLDNEIATIKKDIEITLQEINKRKRNAEEYKFQEQKLKKEMETLKFITIPGVFGYLRGLGCIEQGYEQAVDAASKSFSSVVVEDYLVAEECINIINKKNLGRITFIILNKIEEPNCKRDEKLLFTKIKTEEKFVKCFYFALKDTLVVKTLDEAKELAFGRIRRRVVTVDGKLLERSGIMTGHKSKGIFKSTIDLENAHKNMSNLLESKNKMRNEIEKLNNLINKLVQTYDKIKDKKLIRSEVDEETEKIRKELEVVKNRKMTFETMEKLGELQMIREKLEYLNNQMQELRYNLSKKPVDNTHDMRLELGKIERDLEEANKIEFEVVEYKEEEEKYKLLCEELKNTKAKILDMRNIASKDYKEEVELKIKIEEKEAVINESEKIMYNCKKALDEVKAEYKDILSLLGSNVETENDLEEKSSDSNTSGNSDLEELNEQKLKVTSDKLISKLNSMETDSKNNSINLSEYKQMFHEFNKSKKEYEDFKSKFDEQTKKLNTCLSDCENLKNERLNTFLNGFNTINKHIKDIFNLITFGGNAELDLIDYLNPFKDGIILSIMPPKKAWKEIRNLSGGEKTLSSLALIFALHKYKPSPFYIMDEIDAALDYKNVSIISQYIKKVESQFVIISLRNDMFEISKVLVGVYKNSDASKAVTLDLN